MLKKASPVLANHRLISKLAFISNILNRADVKELTNHLQMNGIFKEIQSGFRIDSGLNSMLVLLDFSAVFGVFFTHQG